jgi:hypothetical protein
LGARRAFRGLTKTPVAARVENTLFSLGPGFFDAVFGIMAHYRVAFEV